MAASINSLLPLDLLLPTLITHVPARLRVLIRRSNEHYQVIDGKIRELVPYNSKGNVTSLLGKHTALGHEVKFRMGLNLWDLEQYICSHPETNIRSEVEMLRMQYNFLHHIFGDLSPCNEPCTYFEHQQGWRAVKL